MNYDLIIVGGGLVGTGLALALASSNLQIALIEAKPPTHHDPRLFALNHHSCQFLKKIKIWPAVAAHAAPIKQVHVSRSGQFAAVRLNAHDIDQDSLGHVIPAQVIEAAMGEALEQMNASPLSHAPKFLQEGDANPSEQANLKNSFTEGFKLTLYRPAVLRAINAYEHHADLQIATAAGEETLSAPLVIGADGTESSVRTLLNLPTQRFAIQQAALVVRTQLNRFHQHIAYERFGDQGTIAMLPLVGNECATIWSGQLSLISSLAALSDSEFLAVLQQKFGYRLGRLLGVTKRHIFDLPRIEGKQATVSSVFLVGNALHTLHPIAAQGFNLAVYEVNVLALAILRQIESKWPFSSAELARIHQQLRKQQNLSMQFSKQLPHLFLQGSVFKQVALQCGMLALDLAGPAKRKLIEKVALITGSQ